jgi:hypothetical protein
VYHFNDLLTEMINMMPIKIRNPANKASAIFSLLKMQASAQRLCPQAARVNARMMAAPLNNFYARGMVPP